MDKAEISWMPVSERFGRQLLPTQRFWIVYGHHEDESECFIFDAWFADGRWVAAYSDRAIIVTHVLVNLRPPIMNETDELVYACQECCDTGCVVDPAKPMAESPADCLVPCGKCNGRELETAIGELLAENKRLKAIANRAHSVADAIVRDMLGQDVVVGDVVWDIQFQTLLPHKSKASWECDNSVRVPHPGECPLCFEGWQAMCLAMQEDGAIFQWLENREWITTECGFHSRRHGDYRRSPACTWKAPHA